MLNKVKLLLGIIDSSKDTLLQTLIEKDENYVMNVTHRTVTTGLEDIIVDCVIYDYNRLGTQGLSSESYSGISYNYLNDYPDNLQRAIRAKRKVGVL